MPGNLGLALPQDLDQITDTDLAACNQVEQAQARAIGQSETTEPGLRIWAANSYLHNMRIDRYVQARIYLH